MKSNKTTIGYLLVLSLLGTIQAKEEKRLAIVIPSYCNAEWYKVNLDSLLSQEYDNWYAIYVDDCSHDGTAELVRSYIAEHNLESKIKLIANPERKGALANHWIATHLCDDWDIVVQYDGDDWFTDTKVLSLINDLYDDPELWLTYGSFEQWPTGQLGYSRPTPEKTVKERLYRETYWTPGQLRTFYAWVFKKIKVEDLLWDHDDESRGKFYPASCDLAFSYPMMEMVGTHFKFIDKIIYIHNVQTALNDFKVNRVPQIIASNALLYKKKYDPVKIPPTRTKETFKGVDVMVISHTRLYDCEETLESCRQHLKGVKNIFVLDVVNNTIGVYDGQQVIKKDETFQSTKHLLVKELHNWWKSTEHVLFIANGLVVKEPLDLEVVAKKLDATQAFAFFPTFGVKDYQTAPCVKLDDDIFLWRLCYADQSWVPGGNELCVFGKKELIRERITYLNDDLVDNAFLRDIFADGMLLIKDATITRVGLSFEQAKIGVA
jgi:glycosyltransferase involved in cell wall biosynthesis